MKTWQQKLEECESNVDRALLAKDLNCDPEMLKVFCFHDLDPMVVKEAALNPHCHHEWVGKAITRFPEIDTPEFQRERNNNLVKLLKSIETDNDNSVNDRDQIILKHIIEKDKLDHANSHLGELPDTSAIKFKTPVKEWAQTDKFRVALVMAPAWGVLFPPYNVAKLTSLLRKYGYSTRGYDLNVESYHRLLDETNEDFWRGERYFLWTVKENFYKFIMPTIKPLLDKAINDLIEANPKVIGFSVYNTNIHATEYLITELKSKLPDACYIAGGPEVVTGGGNSSRLRLLPFNYLFVGEAEETFINLLENLPTNYAMSELIGTTSSKLKLEDFPYPDYTDFHLPNYLHRDGVSIETSRGCVAQCSFCAETYFWKFRSNSPERIVAEMEHQIRTHNVSRFWFVDSLVNGNIKSFRALIDLIIEKDLKINWNSYARCDGRMDKEFMEKIVQSGCTCLSYGIESGSQKVLLDMRKKIDIWEIENNIKDGYAAGLYNHANWILGFPTEEPIDFLHSLTMIFNLRKSLNVISPGFGAGPAAGSHMVTDWKLYGIEGDKYVAQSKFLNAWYTTDYKNTILHRFLRIKFFHIWLEILKRHANSIIENSQRYGTINSFYKFNTDSTCKLDSLNYEEFVDLNVFAGDSLENTIANEYLAFCYGLHALFGSFKITLNSDPTTDLDTFGISLVNNYKSKFVFEVDSEGNFKLELDHNFKHTGLSPDLESIYAVERSIKDQSFDQKTKLSGNIKDWISSQSQIKETIHEQYRTKTKKVIPLIPQ